MYGLLRELASNSDCSYKKKRKHLIAFLFFYAILPTFAIIIKITDYGIRY